MDVKDVWKPTGAKCPSCGQTEYGRFQEDEDGNIVGRAMGRQCDGGCTPDQVAEAEAQ